jgi:hypothetical protein
VAFGGELAVRSDSNDRLKTRICGQIRVGLQRKRGKTVRVGSGFSQILAFFRFAVQERNAEPEKQPVTIAQSSRQPLVLRGIRVS